MRRSLCLAAGAWLAGAAWTLADPSPAIATNASVTPAPVSGVRWSTLDSIPRAIYLERHAFSFDNFLESEPGGLLVRPGPIGYDAFYSRWGIGLGRARLFANGIPLNNPQSGAAPLAHIATSGLGSLVVGDAARAATSPWLEGNLVMEEVTAPATRPNTFVELSKADNDLRQRRVRFASEDGVTGIDLSYDEVLDDGYAFDANASSPAATNFGRARSRQGGIVLRGRPDGESRYAFGIRRLRSSTTGDLADAGRPGTYDGHLTWLEAGAGAATVTAFGRGYTTDEPDSQATNETVGGIVSLRTTASHGASASVNARVEHTRATVDVGTSSSDDLTEVALAVTGGWRAGQSASLTAGASIAGDDDVAPSWAGFVEARRDAGVHAFSAGVARSFRTPTLGERYLPEHVRDGRTLAGNPNLDAEAAWEVDAEWELRAGAFTQRLRAAWMRGDNGIAFRPFTVGTETWRVAENAGGSVAMTFVEERAQAAFRVGALHAFAAASGLFTDGDREEQFRSVPRVMASASVLVGSELFEATSALHAGAEIVYVDKRTDFAGASLPAFKVVNLVLEGRLLDARLYLKYVNVLDEAYRTQGDYLMTPASFVYGIEWTLFD